MLTIRLDPQICERAILYIKANLPYMGMGKQMVMQRLLEALEEVSEDDGSCSGRTAHPINKSVDRNLL